MDEITLSLPREADFAGIVDLVAGGLGARFDFTIEALDDLQTAFELLVAREDGDGEITFHFRVRKGMFEAEVGPFDRGAIGSDLAATDDSQLGLGRVLETVSDDVHLIDGAGGAWIVLRKELELATPAEA